MAPLPHCVCTIVLTVVGVFNNAGATPFVPPANQDFQKIIDSLQDVAKAVAKCQSTDSVAEVLRSQQTTLNQLVSSTVHKPPPPVSYELAIQFEEYRNKFEAAEQRIKQLEERLLQVETTSSQAKEKYRHIESKSQLQQEELTKKSKADEEHRKRTKELLLRVETVSSQAKEKSQNNEGKLQSLKKKVDQATSKNLCRSPFYQVGDNCIYVDRTVKLSWHKCRDFCGSFGGDLAVPSDVLKLRKFLTSFNKGWNYWIGGSDLMREGDWLWLDGRQMDRSVGWQKGEPNNYGGNEDCVHYYADTILIFVDARCTLEHHCVCQDASYPK